MRARVALPFSKRIAADRGHTIALDDAPGSLSVRGEIEPTHALSFLFGRNSRLSFPCAGGRPRQSKILAQRLAGIVLVKQAAPLQFGYDVPDEIGVGPRHIGRGDHKAV